MHSWLEIVPGDKANMYLDDYHNSHLQNFCIRNFHVTIFSVISNACHIFNITNKKKNHVKYFRHFAQDKIFLTMKFLRITVMLFILTGLALQYGESALWVVSEAGETECVKLLLKHGAQVDLPVRCA